MVRGKVKKAEGRVLTHGTQGGGQTLHDCQGTTQGQICSDIQTWADTGDSYAWEAGQYEIAYVPATFHTCSRKTKLLRGLWEGHYLEATSTLCRSTGKPPRGS